MQAIIDFKPNHVFVSSIANSNPCLRHFSSFNQKILNGLKQRGVSNSDQIFEIHECIKKIYSNIMFSTTSFIELKTFCVLMEHENIPVILCFDYFFLN